MTNTVKHYPAPTLDMDNRPVLEAWQAGLLLLPSCSGCSRLFFYPRPLCPHCWSDRLDWRQARGRGTIVSFSLVRRPNDPVFFAEAPIILAEVMLDEGVSMLARIIDDNPDAISSGMTIELLPLPEARGYPLPTFRVSSA